MNLTFAWPSYTSAWSVVVDDVRADGELRTECVDATRRRVRLDHVEGWRSTSATITVTTDERPPEGLTDLAAFVVISSPRANTRMPFRLGSIDADGGGFSGMVTVLRSAVAGACDVTIDIGASVNGRQRLVGVADAWSLIVDPSRAPAPPGKPPFETVWVDFSTSDAPQVARQQPDAYAVMDLTGVKPMLLLNSGVDGLQSLLLPPTARHERRRLREIIGTLIARQATSTLIRAAASELTPPDSEETELRMPQDGLHVQVCEAVAGEMTTVASVAELYERLTSVAHGPEHDHAQLWAEIDAAVDRMTGHSTAVANVVGEVKYV